MALDDGGGVDAWRQRAEGTTRVAPETGGAEGVGHDGGRMPHQQRALPRQGHRLHQARRRRTGRRFSINGRFYLSCFRSVWVDQRLRRAVPLTALLCVWQLANAAGFLYQAFVSRPGRLVATDVMNGQP